VSIREPRKTRLAVLRPVALACLAVQSATAQLSAPPPPINSYIGDPGLPGDPASWRTPEFLRQPRHARERHQPAGPIANMHGVAFNADLYIGNTHKTDGVLYGFPPATRRDDFKI